MHGWCAACSWCIIYAHVAQCDARVMYKCNASLIIIKAPAERCSKATSTKRFIMAVRPLNDDDTLSSVVNNDTIQAMKHSIPYCYNDRDTGGCMVHDILGRRRSVGNLCKKCMLHVHHPKLLEFRCRVHLRKC